jgi:hypothetical protein
MNVVLYKKIVGNALTVIGAIGEIDVKSLWCKKWVGPYEQDERDDPSNF